MKKITLGALLFCGLTTVAQQVNMKPQQANNIMEVKDRYAGLERVDYKPTFSSTQFNLNSLKSGVFHYNLQWADTKEEYEKAVNGPGVAQADFVGYRNVMFMDSTGRSSSSTGDANISRHAIGMVVDPKSPYFDPTFNEIPLLTAADAYKVDTVIIQGDYQRRVNVNDTLVVEITWGDTSNTAVWNYILNGTARMHWKCPYLTNSKQHGHKSYSSAPATNRFRISRVLTAADTVSVGNKYADRYVVVLPSGGLNIPANNIVSVEYTFVPGSYTQGDFVFEYVSPATPATKNGFGGYSVGLPNGATSKGLFYDRSSIDINANPAKTKNACMEWYTQQRYGMYTAPSTWANTTMYPWQDMAWRIETIISNQVIGIDEKSANNLRIAQNIPNPCSGITYIGYDLTENANVTLDIFDVTGKKVQSLNQGKKFAGNYKIEFDASTLEAGIYFYTLTTGENRMTKRMTVVK